MSQNTPEDFNSSLEQPPDLAGEYPAAQQAASSGSRIGKLGLPKYTLPVIAILIGLVVIAGVTVFLLSKRPSSVPTKATPIVINTQSLDNGTLTKLTAKAGPDPTQQQLTISPAALFKNDVAVAGNLQAEKDLGVTGNAAVTGSFGVKGNSTLQGAVGINSNLTVRGALSVGGAISAGSLNIGSLNVANFTDTGNLNFGGHLVPSGATPNAVSSAGTAGGTVTINGNDTAGTVIINTGSSTQIAGEMAIVNFKTAFGGIPKVQLTPVNGAAADLHYYATQSTGFFTVHSTTLPTPNTQYVFNYLVTQ